MPIFPFNLTCPGPILIIAANFSSCLIFQPDPTLNQENRDGEEVCDRVGQTAAQRGVTRAMSTKQVIVTYAQLQDAFHTDPAQLQDAVYRSADQAAGETRDNVRN